jgi:hypothetical protein
LKTAQEYRQEAEQSRNRSQESFERSDTDGFLTQWASDLSARLADTRAVILENGGKANFCGLYEGTRRVAAKLINGQFGLCWLLDDAEATKFGRKFIPEGGNSKIQKKLGLCECGEVANAWAVLGGSGHGLSGTCGVVIYRTGDKWGLDSEIC